MAHIDLYLDNPHQASTSYPFSSNDASMNTDSDANVRCGQSFPTMAEKRNNIENMFLNNLKYFCICCDMSQYDTIGKIELIPASVLSTDKTNC